MVRKLMAKKVKPLKVDGLSPKDLQKIRSAIRQVWHRSYPRKLCALRAIDESGFSKCEKCSERVPKVYIDHIEPVGDILHGGIERMFTASHNLQALCKKCHSVKTKLDNAKTKKAKVVKRKLIRDFY